MKKVGKIVIGTLLVAFLCVALASCSFIDSIKGTVKELAKYIDEMSDSGINELTLASADSLSIDEGKSGEFIVKTVTIVDKMKELQVSLDDTANVDFDDNTFTLEYMQENVLVKVGNEQIVQGEITAYEGNELTVLVNALDAGETTVRLETSDEKIKTADKAIVVKETVAVDIGSVPAFSGNASVEINGNIPVFSDEEKATEKGYEFYSELDSLGRCGVTFALIGLETMPADDRESIGQVKPSGWVTSKYDTSIVDGGYLYNRCHLIGFQLAGENANKRNLITGTRYLNIKGMLPYENLVADYVKETENHVLFRVTPIFVGNELVARGVQMEAYSLEDNGEGICFNVYCYNVQPGIVIDYATGNNRLEVDGQ